MPPSPSGTSHGSPRISLPRTPLPSIKPPKRGSSLAFDSRICYVPGQTDCETEAIAISPLSKPNIRNQGDFASSLAQAGSPPLPNAQIQTKLLAANNTLHRDVYVASSPASSIESRMNLDLAKPLQITTVSVLKVTQEHTKSETKTWRYSTAPENLAVPSIDVREPLPSPTLPRILLVETSSNSYDHADEPISSGFTTPYLKHQSPSAANTIGITLPQSRPLSSYNIETDGAEVWPNLASRCETELDEPMTYLNISTESLYDVSSDESPIVTHLKDRSWDHSLDLSRASSTKRQIYLSETAEAAAESAKAKRRLLKTNVKDIEEPNFCEDDTVQLESAHSRLCHIGKMEPYLDVSSYESGIHMPQRPSSMLNPDMVISEHQSEFVKPLHEMSPMRNSRTTAMGSPMPFTKARVPLLPLSTMTHTKDLPAASSNNYLQCYNSLNDHFSPRWYYARYPNHFEASSTYAFSTAASKVSGSDQAPDSRIRDSYKTDTLTALASPPSRFRKNGIGAELLPRGVHRYYQRPTSSLRSSSARIRPGSRHTYSSGSDIRFRSSPPRGSTPDDYVPIRRKRTVDDSFMASEHQAGSARIVNPIYRLHESDKVMDVDAECEAVAQLNTRGHRNTESLRQTQLGIRELSPNVQRYRKCVQDYSHLRKKRRPTNWDNDLKQIRESPAGRGGVNSPVSAQASMRAEFEIASLRNTEMDLDENDLSGEIAKARDYLESRLHASEQELRSIFSNDTT